jgi:NAD(P)-dependent dehydrogenase (short-subunit alcohol dehydrogenase family)
MSAPVMLVTGAGRGIGAATAVLAATQGYAVAVNYHSRRDDAEALVTTIGDAGGTALALGADVGDEAEIVRLFGLIDRELGPLDMLVNNAGIVGSHGRVEDLDGSVLDRLWAVNITAPFLCAREAVRRMAIDRGGRGGAIVNVSSRAAALGGSGEWIHYAASKGAIDTMTVGLAREVAAQGIRVNAVRPGLIDTDIHEAAPPGRLERMAPGVPMARAGTPEEVAAAIVWLASPAASYVTGTILDVGGGR